jgi:hypothetical protein
VRENAPSDALVITGTQHTNAIAALSGRNIYVGAATFLYIMDWITSAGRNR